MLSGFLREDGTFVLILNQQLFTIELKYNLLSLKIIQK